MIDRRLLRNLDYGLLAIVLALGLVGILFVASASRTEGIEVYGDAFYFARRQLIWLLTGFLLAALVLFVDYTWLVRYGNILYGLNLAMLLAVLLFGSSAGGAQSWFDLGPVKLQWSEFAKPILIVSLGSWIVRRDGLRGWGDIALSGLYVALPTALVLKQPDFGTALVFVAIWFGMIFTAGVPLRRLAAMLASGVGLLVGGVAYISRFGLPERLARYEYAAKRLYVFVQPGLDPSGAGYSLNQSRIAIGSGGFDGRGLFAGPQSQLNFLPARHTDFIFSVIGEEAGFLGGVLVLALLFGLVWCGIRVMAKAKDPFGSLLASGVTAMFLFHTLQNVGMTMGLMPITGIPLLLVSYGGSSTWAAMIGVGLLLNVHMRRHKILF